MTSSQTRNCLMVTEENGYAKDTLRVCTEANQGMRKYMEDELTFTLEEWNHRRSGFLAIFDGHGGKEAAAFAKQHLFNNIKLQPEFQSDNSEQVKKAIRNGFTKTHLEMNADIGNWPKRKDGHNSTSGTTATVAIIRDNKLYIAHVGDSAAVLAKKVNNVMMTEELTVDHKPDNPDEKSRIQSLGGRVAITNGVPRVVWKRAVKNGSTQLGKQTTKHEYVPFLAVSRALGDLWSYDKEREVFIVSPEPDIKCIDIIPGQHKYLILASDGLWGVMSAKEAVEAVYKFETTSKLDPKKRNSSDHLIKSSLSLWQKKRARADNISSIVVFFDNEFVESNRGVGCVSDETLKEANCTDTDLASDTEDTPPLDNSFGKTMPSLKRQLPFSVNKEVPQKLSDKSNIGSHQLRQTKQRGENSKILTETVQHKRKSVELNTVNSSKKKFRTSPSKSLLSSEDSHQCKVITALSSESLNGLQMDPDLGFADDESDHGIIDTEMKPSNLHSKITSRSSFNQIIPVGNGDK